MCRYYACMTKCQPHFDDFKKLAGQGNTIPVYCQLLGDHLTPVTAFAAISENASHAFLLESVVGGENIARYSFLAADPHPPGSKLLHAKERLYRVRSGSYRIIYQVQYDKLVVIVATIGHRRDVYDHL